MCGYIGFTNTIENTEQTLHEMMDKIIHRGPDESGIYTDADIALGFRRLSIIDLEHGSQPIFNEDESLVLVFNGEIYNYKILREELIDKGHTMKTHADSEVVIHAFEEWGSDFLNRLRGMFSLAIWDKNKKKLFAARDFFGIKPFYYAHMNDTFMFGSEIKAFIPHPHFKKEFNEKQLPHYLSFQYSPGDETFFKNVYKLPPAHYLIYKDGEIKTERYWRIDFVQDCDKTENEWIDEVENVFLNSVAAHKISDVEVGSFLSSGIDSSYVACCAEVDKTFTVGFESEQYNETNYAKELSDLIGVQNFSKTITPDEFWNAFPKIQYHMDEPLADPAAAALYFVAQLAAKQIKVVLSGEGADEIFGGYNIYQEPITGGKYEKIPFFIRRIISVFASLLPQKRGINYLVRRGKKLEDKFIGNAYIFTKKEREKLLSDPQNASAPSALCKPYYDKIKLYDDITKMQYLDLHMWMVGDILLKADKMSMAHSLELRVPFLDKEIMKLAEKIPTKYRCNTHKTKYVLREAAARKIPQKVADKKKLGFPVPIRVWLKQDKFTKNVRNHFESEHAKKYFKTDRLIKLLKNHIKGKQDNSRKIWTVYTFLVWYGEYFG